MERILPDTRARASAAQANRVPLYGAAASRDIEQRARQALPPHTLMQRAGTAVARLARAWRPHARRICVVAGGGNNGGDGLLAAALLRRHLAGLPGADVRVWWLGDKSRLPEDAHWALEQAEAAGVPWDGQPPDVPPDLVIDALFGLGLSRAVEGAALDAIRWMQRTPAPSLCVDLPSGLSADTGHWWAHDTPIQPAGPRLTLMLLTRKPGVFTGTGRACAGNEIWFDDLGVAPEHRSPDAWLWQSAAWPDVAALRCAHSSHKGSRGDVLVLGGQLPGAANGAGMVGAALLAGRAALRAGAGRVYVGLLGPDTALPAVDAGQPGLMLRTARAALDPGLLAQAVVVAGCGGGAAIAPLLDTLLSQAPRLVLDADALNALGPVAANGNLPAPFAQRRATGACTVLTPHPLEAARLLGTDVARVQADRLQAARTLANRLGVAVVLKGSGTVAVAPETVPIINATGNGLLASAGTGDVLAGLVGARLASCATPPTDLGNVAADAVAAHGALADAWFGDWPLTATDLTR